MTDKNLINRREFMGVATWVIGGLMSAGMGIPAIAFIIGPAMKDNTTQSWIRLGSVKKIEIGVPTLFKTKVKHQTGWVEDESELSVYILTNDGFNFVAMSSICTHLACRVRWIAEKQQFFCPCHNAIFNKEGNVVAGPPPRPLDRYTIKVENDQLFIGQLEIVGE